MTFCKNFMSLTRLNTNLTFKVSINRSDSSLTFETLQSIE